MLFEYLGSINTGKEYLMNDATSEKEYVPFMINRGLSLFADTCLFANEMNMRSDTPKKMQYDFYYYGVPKKKRFSKWPKKEEKLDEVKALAEHMNISYEKAKVYLSILNPTQIEEIRNLLDMGGTRK